VQCEETKWIISQVDMDREGGYLIKQNSIRGQNKVYRITTSLFAVILNKNELSVIVLG
jgi:hypothetical protein